MRIKIQTPFSRMKYKGLILKNEVFKRPFKVALRCWWQWDVLPWFKKTDYIPYPNGTKDYFYRWQKYIGKHSNYIYGSYDGVNTKRFYSFNKK